MSERADSKRVLLESFAGSVSANTASTYRERLVPKASGEPSGALPLRAERRKGEREFPLSDSSPNETSRIQCAGGVPNPGERA